MRTKGQHKSNNRSTSRLPVFYVLGKDNIDPRHFITSFMEFYSIHQSEYFLFFCESSYAFTFDNFVKPKLQAECNSTHMAFSQFGPVFQMPKTEKELESTEGWHTFCGRKFKLLPDHPNIEDYTIVYIGKESSLTSLNLLMTFNKCKVSTIP